MAGFSFAGRAQTGLVTGSAVFAIENTLAVEDTVSGQHDSLSRRESYFFPAPFREGFAKS